MMKKNQRFTEKNIIHLEQQDIYFFSEIDVAENLVNKLSKDLI